MTTAGKLLTFLNLFIGIGLLTWSLSAYSTGANWTDRKTETETVKGQITLFNEEIAKLTKAAADAQAGYGASNTALVLEEADRDFRRKAFADRLRTAREDLNPKLGSFRVQVPQNPGQPYPPANRPGSPAFTDLTKEGPAVPGPDGKTPLRGLKALQDDFAREVRQGQDLINGRPINQQQWGQVRAGLTQQQFDDLAAQMGITDLRKLNADLSDLITVADAAVLKQKEIRAALRDEARYLADQRTNWVVQLQTLERRHRQLENQLQQLKADGR